jgi:hypothetical protein
MVALKRVKVCPFWHDNLRGIGYLWWEFVKLRANFVYMAPSLAAYMKEQKTSADTSTKRTSIEN